jgi:dipeptidyl aminopeptidase/acylaminoacyl peptidase
MAMKFCAARFQLALVFFLGVGLCWGVEGKHPITFAELVSLGRVSDPQISPDGAWVAYTLTRYDREKNAGDSDVWLVPISGGSARQLTRGEKRDNNPRWSPDGKKIAFISNRQGGPQVWLQEVSGGEPRKLTSISTGADGVIWSPDGANLAFTSDVYPDCKDDACNKKRDEDAEASKVKAKIFDRLLYRHWDSWKDGKRTHVFVMPASGGQPRDATPGDYDTPPFSLGGPTDYDFSPDGKELCFARNTDKVEAASTNVDLWVVSTGGGAARKITSNPAYDGSPLYSPDGKYIAYRAQKRPGFESDRFELMLYDRSSGDSRSLTSALDRAVGGMVWVPGGKGLFFTAEDEAYSTVFSVSVPGGKFERVIQKSFADDVKITPDGRTLVYARQSISSPVELYRASADGRNITPLTRVNDAALARIEFGAVENIRYKGAAGDDVQAWIVKPPGFDPARKWPAIVLIHGGPQGAWNDAFSFRWNIPMFASRGYVVFACNPRGSTGFGQKFTDEISGDWGGKVYEDIMKGVDHFARLPYVDASRMAAAGASYGGYMINWIAGHSDRFRCLVSHDGVYNTVSMYGATEELWFPEWEFKGTPWTNPEMYARWSPSSFVKNFKTPTLVIHGELDYRVPVAEGFQLFTALQKMGVPSKFLYFPDEGHWVLKPQNSDLWYKTVLDWIDQHTK